MQCRLPAYFHNFQSTDESAYQRVYPQRGCRHPHTQPKTEPAAAEFRRRVLFRQGAFRSHPRACTAWLVQARTPFRKMPSSVRFKPVIIWREYPCRRRNHSTVRFSRSSSGETTYVNLCPIHKTSVSIAFLSNEPRHFGAKFQKETFPVFRKYSRKQMEKQETYLSIAKI